MALKLLNAVTGNLIACEARRTLYEEIEEKGNLKTKKIRRKEENAPTQKTEMVRDSH